MCSPLCHVMSWVEVRRERSFVVWPSGDLGYLRCRSTLRLGEAGFGLLLCEPVGVYVVELFRTVCTLYHFSSCR